MHKKYFSQAPRDFAFLFLLGLVSIGASLSAAKAQTACPIPPAGPNHKAEPYIYVAGPNDIVDFPDNQKRPDFYAVGPFADVHIQETLDKFRNRTGRGAEPTGFAVHNMWNREYVQIEDLVYENRYNDLTESERAEYRHYFAERAYSVLNTDISSQPVNLLVFDPLTVAGVMAVMFPDHPDHAKFRDAFMHAVRYADRHYIRKDTPEMGLHGGRYMENIGCYDPWAFGMRSMAEIPIYLRDPDGIYLPDPDLEHWLGYKLNTLSPKLTGDTGDGDDTRVVPPQGAHASPMGRYNIAREYAYAMMMERYAPRVKDAWSWLWIDNRPWTEADFKTYTYKDIPPCPIEKIQDLNWKGAKPKVTSEKLADYGVVFRRDYGTPQEMSLTVTQQLSTNYRWGQNQSGQIFYFADGKAWTWNGSEDSGDAQVAMGLGNTYINAFATMHDGKPLMIGKTQIKNNLYDFGFAGQYTVLGNGPADGYDPFGKNQDYLKRCVTLVGSDYIVVFDQVANPQIDGDFRWFNKEEWKLPNIVQVKPGATAVSVSNDYPDARNKTQFPRCVGVSYTGKGNFLTVVSHKPVTAVAEPWGTLVNGTDEVFYDDTPVQLAQNGEVFDGRAGYIAGNKLALFDGTKIGAQGVVFEKDDAADFGFSATMDGAHLRLLTSGRSGKLTVHLPKVDPAFKLYQDGHVIEGETTPDGLALNVPEKMEGNTVWEWTDQKPTPLEPRMLAEAAGKGSVHLTWNDCGEGVTYSVQRSTKWGPWEALKTGLATPELTLDGLTDGTPYIYRVKAEQGPETWSDEIISVPTPTGPVAPDGLESPDYYQGAYFNPMPLAPGETVGKQNPEPVELALDWGRVRGATTYLLEKRTGAGAWTTAAKDLTDPHWLDHDAPLGQSYQYRVTASNLNGPGATSPAITVNRAAEDVK